MTKKININCILLLLALSVVRPVTAQTINWDDIDNKPRHMLHVDVGMEYGLVYRLGYMHALRNKLFPVVLETTYSFPSGNVVFDDFKTSAGGHVQLVKYKNFVLISTVRFVFRNYNNDYVHLANFGSDIAGTIGYYRSRWFIGIEAGFDKAISTYFGHTKTYQSIYPGVVDGWYKPATGGNFYNGLVGGCSFVQHDVYLKIGMVITEDFKTTPLIPFYGQLGYNFKF